MKLVVRLDAEATHGWHLALLERIAALGSIEATVAWVPGGDIGPALSVLRLESALTRPALRGFLQSAPEALFGAWRATGGGSADLTLDLSSATGWPDGRCWRLTFDGQPGPGALIAATVNGRTPLAEVREGEVTLASARLGTDCGENFESVLEHMLERTITLIVGALQGHRSLVGPLPGDVPPAASSGSIASTALRRIAKGLARGAATSVYRRLYWAPHWRVGWRRLKGPDLLDLRRHPDEGWIDLPDDGTRFYADPFPFEHDGKVTLFVEDFVHTVGRGIISAVTFGADGPEGRPEPVLELEHHLSYPFVFAADGEIWMVPECCASGRIDLFRATNYPGGWVREATLVHDVVASDATLIEHEGVWWMFATLKDGGGFSDALHLWSAPDFRGPWVPHRANPVLIDIAAARPAGRMVVRNGALYRPVQDCRGGYGKALALARVTRLDADGFDQEVETILEAGGPLWAGRRIHSLNSGGGFEFIDGSREARRFLRS